MDKERRAIAEEASFDVTIDVTRDLNKPVNIHKFLMMKFGSVNCSKSD